MQSSKRSETLCGSLALSAVSIWKGAQCSCRCFMREDPLSRPSSLRACSPIPDPASTSLLGVLSQSPPVTTSSSMQLPSQPILQVPSFVRDDPPGTQIHPALASPASSSSLNTCPQFSPRWVQLQLLSSAFICYSSP